MRRSGQKLPATTLFGQSEENTDFEPKPFFAITRYIIAVSCKVAFFVECFFIYRIHHTRYKQILNLKKGVEKIVHIAIIILLLLRKRRFSYSWSREPLSRRIWILVCSLLGGSYGTAHPLSSCLARPKPHILWFHIQDTSSGHRH